MPLSCLWCVLVLVAQPVTLPKGQLLPVGAPRFSKFCMTPQELWLNLTATQTFVL